MSLRTLRFIFFIAAAALLVIGLLFRGYFAPGLGILLILALLSAGFVSWILQSHPTVAYVMLAVHGLFFVIMFLGMVVPVSAGSDGWGQLFLEMILIPGEAVLVIIAALLARVGANMRAQRIAASQPSGKV